MILILHKILKNQSSQCNFRVGYRLQFYIIYFALINSKAIFLLAKVNESIVKYATFYVIYKLINANVNKNCTVLSELDD